MQPEFLRTAYGKKLFHEKFLDASDPVHLELLCGGLHSPDLDGSTTFTGHGDLKPPVIIGLDHFT